MNETCPNCGKEITDLLELECNGGVCEECFDAEEYGDED